MQYLSLKVPVTDAIRVYIPMIEVTEWAVFIVTESDNIDNTLITKLMEMKIALVNALGLEENDVKVIIAVDNVVAKQDKRVIIIPKYTVNKFINSYKTYGFDKETYNNILKFMCDCK